MTEPRTSKASRARKASPGRRAKPKSKTAEAAVEAAEKAGAKGKAAELSAAQVVLRDQSIVALRSLGYSWSSVAEKVNLSVRQVQDRYRAQMAAPSITAMSPVALVDQILREFRASVAAYDVIAFEQMEKNANVALGAKKAADEMRGRILAICADIGVFPQDLTQWRTEAELDGLIEELMEIVSGIEDGSKSLADLKAWKDDISREAPQIGYGEVEEVVDAEIVDEGR